MKKKLFSIALVLVMMLMFACPQGNVVADEGVKTLDVMFMHDNHSHLNPFATVEGEESVIMGGFSRLQTLVNAQKEKNPDTLILDGGDFSMGTLVQVVYEEEASELRMMGTLGVDATVFGNHEFDYRAEGMANMLNAAKNSGDRLPEVLICNVDWDGMKAKGLTEDQKLLLEAYESFGVKDYTIVQKGDVKIAVIGVFGVNAEACVANCPVEFKDPVEAVKSTVATIKAKENVDMIACVSHGGTWEKEEESEDEILAKAVPEIDLIISGHTHTMLEKPIQHGNTYIVSSAEYGKYLGNMSMKQNARGRWDITSYELIPVTTDIVQDEATQKKVDEFMGLVDTHYLSKFGYTKDQVLCTNEVKFNAQKDLEDLHTEINLGSIIADAYAYAVNSSDTGDDNPVVVAVAPSGTIRDSYALGNITVENVFNSFSLGIGEDGVPGYPLLSVYLTGEELKTAAEIDASISDFSKTARLYTYGLYWTYNPNRLILNKVTDAYVHDSLGNPVELEDKKLYRVITDYYTSQMLAGVTDMSYGLLSLQPKFKDGTPIEKFEDAIIMVNGKELKGWEAIAKYMLSFEDTDGDGVGNVPAMYATTQDRKVVEDSWNIGDLIKNPNKFFFIILGVIVALVIVLFLIIRAFCRFSRKYGIITKFRQLKRFINKVKEHLKRNKE